MSTAALLAALEKIAKVEPKPAPGTTVLDVLAWSIALDEAQRIARGVLDDWYGD